MRCPYCEQPVKKGRADWGKEDVRTSIEEHALDCPLRREGEELFQYLYGEEEGDGHRLPDGEH